MPLRSNYIHTQKQEMWRYSKMLIVKHFYKKLVENKWSSAPTAIDLVKCEAPSVRRAAAVRT